MILLALFGPLVMGRLGDVTVCPTAGIFSVPCPGCGLTRAGAAALSGEYEAAFHYHPLFFVIVPFYGAAVLHVVLAVVLGRRLPPTPRWVDRWVTFVAVGVAVMATVVWVLRFAGYFGGPVHVVSWFSWR